MERGEEFSRFVMMGEGIALWRKSPILGHGAGQFAGLGSTGLYSHCNYTEILANYGCIGFALYYSLLAVLLARVVPRALRGRSDQQVLLVLLVMILSLDFFFVAYSGKLAWMFLAAIAWLTEEKHRQPSLPANLRR
jgi:O-antigen ligase